MLSINSAVSDPPPGRCLQDSGIRSPAGVTEEMMCSQPRAEAQLWKSSHKQHSNKWQQMPFTQVLGDSWGKCFSTWFAGRGALAQGSELVV